MGRTRAAVIGLIVAGGRASRMGGEKPLMPFLGRPLIAHAIERAQPQVDELLLNVNEPARFQEFGYEIIQDRVGGNQGPLAGVLAGLDWMHENRFEAKWLATFSCDAPFFPTDLVQRLVSAAEAAGAFVGVAQSGKDLHPVFAVWRTAISTTSEETLKFGTSRRMEDFIDGQPNVRVSFESQGGLDPFFNINTPEDLFAAEKILE